MGVVFCCPRPCCEPGTPLTEDEGHLRCEQACCGEIIPDDELQGAMW